MARFYRCTKCGFQFMSPDSKVRNDMTCGAVADYVVADDPEVGNDGIIQSAGIKPLGCGGKIKEVTLEEAMTYVQGTE